MKPLEEGVSCGNCGERSPRYNGWTNYETWAVNLWLDNDEGAQDYWRDRAESRLNEAEPLAHLSKKESAIINLSQELRHEIEYGDTAPDLGASLYGDLLNAALGSVNWYEIAKHMIENVEVA